MNISDPIGDMITRIRNAQRMNKADVIVPHSKFRMSVLDVLVREGYIRGYSESEVRKGISNLVVQLKYFEGKPTIYKIERVSRPGLRCYKEISDIRPVANGLGINVVSTSRGVLSDAEARQQGVGGEVLFKVY